VQFRTLKSPCPGPSLTLTQVDAPETDRADKPSKIAYDSHWLNQQSIVQFRVGGLNGAIPVRPNSIGM